MRIALSFILYFLALSVHAQFRFVEDRSIPVSIEGNALLRPWEGGINAAQYQKMDLNNDGTPDLVVYHRMAGELSTYLASGSGFVYSPDYTQFFPEEVSDWLILADYNCDGRKDIFTSTPLGIKVFENTTTGDTPDWTEAVNFVTFNEGINLQVNASDIPGIADIDGDGDLDILAYRFSSSNTIDYYKNQSIENTGSCGALTFIRETRRWGDLEECDCNSFAFGAPCPTGGTANPEGSLVSEASEHAGGKTILPIDVDNDGDMDLITSDEFCETLYFMENEGTAELAAMTSFSNFPASSPADFYIFPSAFYEDVTMDGERDLIISTNADNNIGNLIDLTASSRLFENQGTDDIPAFNTTTNFLQGDMIDLGETTYPSFADIDGDSDLDMIVGNRGTLIEGELRATLHLFENVGTRLRPAFNLTNTDYLGFAAERLRSLKPQWTDLDGDGDQDLVYMATSLENNRTTLSFRLNDGSFNLGTATAMSLTVTETNQFHMTRLDGDNLPDLLIASSLGSITAFRNLGNASFSEGRAGFAGRANSFDSRNPSILAADLDGDGVNELLITDITGNLQVLTGNLNFAFEPTQTVTSLLETGLLTDLQRTTLGELSPLTAADIFGDGRPALILGNIRGGMYVYRNLSNADGGPGAPNISLFAFPNPTTGSLFLQSNSDGMLDIYTLNGQRIRQDIPVLGQEQLEIDTQQLPAGLYLFRVTNGSSTPGVVKVLVQR